MLRPFVYLAAVTVLVSNAISQTTTTPIWLEGYYVNGQTTSPVNCNTTQTFISSGRYAGCFDTTEAATTACVPATECFGKTLLYPGGATVDCNEFETSGLAYSCGTMTVFSTAGGSSLFALDCYTTTWSVYTIIQNLAIITSSISTVTTSSISSISFTTSIASPATSASATSTPTNSTTLAPSKAWIAGAVIGPLSAIAAVGLLGYWIGRRRLKAAADSDYNQVAQIPAPSGERKSELPS